MQNFFLRNMSKIAHNIIRDKSKSHISEQLLLPILWYHIQILHWAYISLSKYFFVLRRLHTILSKD